MHPLDLVKLGALMGRTSGRPEVRIGFIDGPVLTRHPDLAGGHLHVISGAHGTACTQADSPSCFHGTFVAGILSARRGSAAPAICPGCTLLIRPLFIEAFTRRERRPCATPLQLAAAIIETIEAGARVINLSLGLARPSTQREQALDEALDHAVRKGVIVVAAAGNQGTLGSSAITRHPWVIPVVACDLNGRPRNDSNLGSSLGRRGLSAPGDGITSLSPEGPPVLLGGTSVAAPFVTGVIALLWSEFPGATAAQIKLAVTQAPPQRRACVVPPLLDAAAAYQNLGNVKERGRIP